MFYPTRPERAEALKYQAINKAFALTGRLAVCYYTQGDALKGLGASALSGRAASGAFGLYLSLRPVTVGS